MSLWEFLIAAILQESLDYAVFTSVVCGSADFSMIDCKVCFLKFGTFRCLVFSIAYTDSLHMFVFDVPKAFCRFTPSSNAIANSSACPGFLSSVHHFSFTFLLFKCTINMSNTKFIVFSPKSQRASSPLRSSGLVHSGENAMAIERSISFLQETSHSYINSTVFKCHSVVWGYLLLY